VPRRKMSWTIIVWTIVFAIWIIAAIADRPSVTKCAPVDALCKNASDTGTAIGAGLVFLLWFGSAQGLVDGGYD
jgi:hypothetical protein